ncbi:MAG: hypothetical protein IPG04_33435 [Polyangiaceae bacterium]|nr:hypothetical protein [Polyangiaceae bacterium]
MGNGWDPSRPGWGNPPPGGPFGPAPGAPAPRQTPSPFQAPHAPAPPNGGAPPPAQNYGTMMMPAIDGPPGAPPPAPPPPNKFAGTMVMETPMPPVGGGHPPAPPPPAPPPPSPFGGHAFPPGGPMSQQPDSDREDRTMLAPNMGPGMPPPMTMQTMIGAPLGGPPIDRDSAFEGGGRTMMASFPEMSASMGLGSMGGAQPEPIRIQAFVDPSASPPAPAGPPAPAAQYAAMVNAAMAAQPAPKRTPWGLIIGVILLVGLAVGCGVYFLTRGSSEVEDETISIPTARETAEAEEKSDAKATSDASSAPASTATTTASASAAAPPNPNPKPLLTARPKPAPTGDPKPAPTSKSTSEPGGGFIKPKNKPAPKE